jgi:hypothetical protein
MVSEDARTLTTPGSLDTGGPTGVPAATVEPVVVTEIA